MDKEKKQFQIIRLREQDAIDAVLRTCDDAFDDRPITKRDNYPQLLSKFSTYACFFAAISPEPMGYAAVYANDTESRTAFFSLLAVRPKYQGLHIGSELMDTVLRYARGCAMETIRLEVRRDNLSAIRMYRKFGFVEESETTAQSIFMRRSLCDYER